MINRYSRRCRPSSIWPAVRSLGTLAAGYQRRTAGAVPRPAPCTGMDHASPSDHVAGGGRGGGRRGADGGLVATARAVGGRRRRPNGGGAHLSSRGAADPSARRFGSCKGGAPCRLHDWSARSTASRPTAQRPMGRSAGRRRRCWWSRPALTRGCGGLALATVPRRRLPWCGMSWRRSSRAARSRRWPQPGARCYARCATSAAPASPPRRSRRLTLRSGTCARGRPASRCSSSWGRGGRQCRATAAAASPATVRPSLPSSSVDGRPRASRARPRACPDGDRSRRVWL